MSVKPVMEMDTFILAAPNLLHFLPVFNIAHFDEGMQKSSFTSLFCRMKGCSLPSSTEVSLGALF